MDAIQMVFGTIGGVFFVYYIWEMAQRKPGEVRSAGFPSLYWLISGVVTNLWASHHDCWNVSLTFPVIGQFAMIWMNYHKRSVRFWDPRIPRFLWVGDQDTPLNRLNEAVLVGSTRFFGHGRDVDICALHNRALVERLRLWCEESGDFRESCGEAGADVLWFSRGNVEIVVCPEALFYATAIAYERACMLPMFVRRWARAKYGKIGGYNFCGIRITAEYLKMYSRPI
jgi:hypothetical protein